MSAGGIWSNAHQNTLKIIFGQYYSSYNALLSFICFFCFFVCCCCCISRVPVSTTFVEMVVGRLRSDDIYNQVKLSSASLKSIIYYFPHLISSSLSPPLCSLPVPSPCLLDLLVPQPRAPQHSTIHPGRDALRHPVLCSEHSDDSASSDERDSGQAFP